MQSASVCCPWCNEPFDVNIDLATIEGDFCEECPHCSFPVKLLVQRDVAGNVMGLAVQEDKQA